MWILCQSNKGRNSILKVECNLCQWRTDNDNIHGIKRHEEWHSKARIQRRNTTQGIVKWLS